MVYKPIDQSILQVPMKIGKQSIGYRYDNVLAMLRLSMCQSKNTSSILRCNSNSFSVEERNRFSRIDRTLTKEADFIRAEKKQVSKFSILFLVWRWRREIETSNRFDADDVFFGLHNEQAHC